jgi:hypothetical protein
MCKTCSTEVDIKWAFIISVIKLIKPEDVTFENMRYGGVHVRSKFINLCEWARANNE